MLFSQRYGYNPLKEIQVDSMDVNLKTGLWNVFYSCFLEISMNSDQLHGNYYQQAIFAKTLWRDHFKLDVDNFPSTWSAIRNCVKQIFDKYYWWGVYDLLEYSALNYPNEKKSQILIAQCNNILEREVSGYRFIGKLIAPIIDEHVINQIESALSNPLKAVRTHLETALILYSDKQSPDYRNSIKESISSVESLCCIMANKSGADLREALKTIKQLIPLHGALEEGLSKIYAYTSDEKGVRHKLMDESNIEAEDALFMLGTCSAFINYLVAKAGRCGIDLKLYK